MTRIGVRSTPWSGAQMSSSVNREFSEHGPRVFANIGLTQSCKVGDAWAMDAGVDRSDTLVGATAERFNPNVPLVAGSIAGDFLATFFGAQYRADVWTITSRVERRDATIAERWSFTGGFFREPIEGRALSVTTRWLDNEMATGDGRTVDARVSYAFRPRDEQLIVLERLDLAEDERVETTTSFETTRFVNNVNLHWQFDNRFELGTQLGARYANSTIDGEPYSGWSTLLGLDLRRDLTRVLDFGVHGTRLDSEAAGTSERSFGIDLGITSARNLWISVGYNFEGFRDEHFDASRYTARRPVRAFPLQDRSRHVQGPRSFGAAPRPLTRKTSLVTCPAFARRITPGLGEVRFMNALKWWLRIVGSLYLLEGVGIAAQAFFVPAEFAAIWASVPAETLDAIAVRGMLVAGLPGVLTGCCSVQ